MPKSRPPALGASLRFLRFAYGWSEEELGRALGIKPVLISRYERGSKTLSRERLEELLAVMGVPSESIEGALYTLGVGPAFEGPGSPVDPTSEERRKIHQTAAVAGQGAAEAIRSQLTANIRQIRTSQDRGQAGELWQTLQELPPRQRLVVVEKEKKYRNWALAERICAESARAAAHRADRAMELAGLALRIAEMAPGSEPWCSRLQGYAWAFVGNARRVHGDLPGAEEAFLRSDQLWEAGAAADPGLLDASRLLDLKASLRSYQGRLDEALSLLDQALQRTITSEAQSRLLVQKANALRFRGSYNESNDALRKAEALIQEKPDLRLSFLVRFTLAANLWQLQRNEEAETLLPKVRELAVGLGNELDLVRVLWLEGRVLAGLKRIREALPILEQVRRYFTASQIAYDAALASLEVAVFYLEEERTGEVKRLAEEMLWIFKTQGVHKEALAALRLFCEAAGREEATAELARRVVDYLVRARNNPGLRFEA
ncbi:MAG TPA: helix-turn-helix domain-containing protein [Thermoanaerobaculia bacterium]|jgi:transcriptional regulator with XRE-family HTH domain|nr:helix-turn-helix domain-containing protein [Thermoanaerobaculia bacterium]